MRRKPVSIQASDSLLQRPLINTRRQPDPCGWRLRSPSPRRSPSRRGRTIWQSQARSPSSELRKLSRIAPSPWGEGRGEGDRDFRTEWFALQHGAERPALARLPLAALINTRLHRAAECLALARLSLSHLINTPLQNGPGYLTLAYLPLS